MKRRGTGFSRFETVRDVKSPLETANSSQFSTDGRSALVTFDLLGEDDVIEDNVTPVLAAIDKVQAANPDLRVEQFGDASTDEAVSKTFADDLRKAETLSLPITLSILVSPSAPLSAAGVPLLLGDLGRRGGARPRGRLQPVVPSTRASRR